MNSAGARVRHFPAAGLVLLTAATIGFDQAGFIANTPMLTSILAFALLVIGLPHGSFDLALLRRAGVAGSSLSLILLYIGAAAAMYLVWRLAPVLALAAFLAMAVAHFVEDWDACGSRFIATGIAGAMVAAPAVLHAASLRGLFTALTGEPGAAVLADVLLLVAPVAIAVALVGFGLLWQTKRPLAISAGCALAAMLFLQPIVGFAIFFCLVHSPLQFRSHTHTLGLRGARQWRGIVVPISLGGLGVAGAIFLANNDATMPTSVFAASFMTLSVLTVPHMLVPMFTRQFSRGPLLSFV